MKNSILFCLLAFTLTACGTAPNIRDIQNEPRRGTLEYVSWHGDLKPTDRVFQILVFCNGRYIVDDTGSYLDPTDRFIKFRCER